MQETATGSKKKPAVAGLQGIRPRTTCAIVAALVVGVFGAAGTWPRGWLAPAG